MWTVNQADLTLTATDSPDRIAIQADTVTPNFKEYVYRLNGGDWHSEKGLGKDPHSRQFALDWRLMTGTNSFEIKTRNLFERDGRPSRVVVFRDRGAPSIGILP